MSLSRFPQPQIAPGRRDPPVPCAEWRRGWDWSPSAPCLRLELRSSSHRKVSSRLRRMAEGVGFEPTDPCGSPVFKTGAIDRSTTPPDRGKLANLSSAGKRLRHHPLVGFAVDAWRTACFSPIRPQSPMRSPEASTSHRPSSRTKSTFNSMGNRGSSPISTTRARSPSTLLLFTRKRSGKSCPPITASAP